MSKLEELIQQYCPDGVEYKEVQEVAKTTSPKGKLKSNDYLKEGKYPVIDQGQSFIGGYTNEEIAFEQGEYVIFGDHTCVVKYVNFSFVQGADGVKVITASDVILPRFLYYCMSNIYMPTDYARHWSKMKVEKIPIPPLPVQEEIVRILDTFTELQAELQAELQKRLQQYNYYRDNLLSFEGRTDVEWKKLGDVADLLSGFPFDSTQFTSAGIRLMRGVNIKRGQLCFNENDDRYWKSTAGLEKYIVEENDIVISMDGSLVGKSFGMVKKEHLPLLLVQRVARIRSSVFNINFIYHCIKNWFPNYVDKKKTKGAIPHISMKDIANFPLPSLSLEEQEKIATILDRFDTLTNDLSQGLPAEIEARRKQYEYYRDQLLTFKKKA